MLFEELQAYNLDIKNFTPILMEVRFQAEVELDTENYDMVEYHVNSMYIDRIDIMNMKWHNGRSHMHNILKEDDGKKWAMKSENTKIIGPMSNTESRSIVDLPHFYFENEENAANIITKMIQHEGIPNIDPRAVLTSARGLREYMDSSCEYDTTIYGESAYKQRMLVFSILYIDTSFISDIYNISTKKMGNHIEINAAIQLDDEYENFMIELDTESTEFKQLVDRLDDALKVKVMLDL